MSNRHTNSTIAKNQRRRAAAQKKLSNLTGNPENPAVPLDPDFWDELGWLGARSDSGVRMNHQSAIGHPPIWRAINLIARGVAKLPMDVWKLEDNDDAEIDKKHPAHKLLARKANENMRSYTWKTTMLYHAIFRGNGYSGIVRKGAAPAGLVLLDPLKTESYWSGDKLWYKTEAGGQKRKLPAADVFHIKGLSLDGINGHDVLKVMANAMGMGPAGRKWMSKLLSRGSTAGGLLQLPRELSPEARKKRQEEFEKYQEGLDNAFKTLALEDGAKWIRTMVTPQEAAIFQVLAFDAKLVSNVFGIPAHKLGDDSKAAYNSLEQENKSYLEDALDPWCIEFETEGSDKLLTESQKDDETHEVRIDRRPLELADQQVTSAAATTLVNGGLIVTDEGRAMLNLAPLPNGEGKKLRIPVNLAVDGQLASQSGSDPKPADPEPKPPVPPAAGTPAMKNALTELVGDRLRRLDKIARDGLVKVTSKGDAAVGDFWRNHREKIRDALAPILPVLATSQGLDAWPRSAEQLADLLQAEIGRTKIETGEPMIGLQVAIVMDPEEPKS